MDAVIGYLAQHADEAQSMMGRRPVVGLDYPDSRAAGRISFDYPHAARLALDHLHATGRKKIAFLDSDQGGAAGSRGAAAAAVADELGITLTQLQAVPSATEARNAVGAFLATHGDV
ncbi:hypothetical protein, partial [Escherichia coli]|uniref:hypothetical protein n=1 Tax=Escherichia coli TaxID=562 RepID=UPI0032E42B40